MFDDCKLTQETFNNFQDEDGCPDDVFNEIVIYDSDNDGFLDNVDNCLTLPETLQQLPR